MFGLCNFWVDSLQCSDLAKNRITEEISQKFAAASGFAKSFSSWGLNAPLAGAMDTLTDPPYVDIFYLIRVDIFGQHTYLVLST